MTDLRDEAIADLRAMIDAGRRCADQIETAVLAYNVVLDGLLDGLGVNDAIAVAGVADARRDVTRLMEEFQSARAASRDSLMRADIVSGSSAKSVSETWGLARADDERYDPGAED